MPEALARSETRPWRFTIVRARGLQRSRAEKSLRPIVVVTVENDQSHELNLGCDGQNPNLKQCFHFNDVDASSRIDICIYHLATSKKKNKKRNLIASACCTLQELARLQAQQQCKQKSVEIKLNNLSYPKDRANKSKSKTILLVARLDLPEPDESQPGCAQEGVDVGLDVLSEDSEDRGYSSTSSSDLSEDPIFVWPDQLSHHHPELKGHTGYWSNSDGVRSEDEREPFLRHADEPVLLAQRSNGENTIYVKNTDYKPWFAASILPAYTETASVNAQASTIDFIVDWFSPYRKLREARVDSDYERVLTELSAEWRFIGGSLVALSGLEAGVFGFSSTSMFIIDAFSRRAIAIGSIASGIGLAIDAWFLFAYCNATPTKFQKMALDVYGKYLFFSISARIPALCMFTSALALMAFLLSVAWAAWPTAVLVMSFMAGVLVSLQFIVYGVHCAVLLIVEAVRFFRRGVVRCFAWLRPSPPPPPPAPDTRERHAPEK